MMKLIPPPYIAPDWLMEMDKYEIHHGPFPLKDILQDSLYYPSSGLDGKPVEHLGGAVFSFVHADYGVSSVRLVANLGFPGFLGYTVFGGRDVSGLLDVQAWRPPGWRRPMEGRFGGWVCKPFAYWFVLQRQKGFEDDHGPRRFSLLYLCVEGVATYHHLYSRLGISPRYLAIIQPGHGTGGFNWTDYTKADSPLHRAVMHHRTARPEYLLYGGWGVQSFYRGNQCWPEYPTEIAFFPGRNKCFGVWERSGN